MQVTINGQLESAPDSATIADLLSFRRVESLRVAVEVNEILIPRRKYDATILHEGDHIEIVTFVGGG